MKKKTVAIGALLLAMNSFSQTDTLVESVSGKDRFKFNYKTNELIKVIEPKEYKNYKFNIKKNELLYLDLLDDLIKDNLYVKERDIDVYLRNGEHEHLHIESVDITLEFNGVKVKEVIVYKPKKK